MSFVTTRRIVMWIVVAAALIAAIILAVRLSGTAARAFAKRATAVVSAGRPPCPFCGGPLDASGHVCPRANGYRR